LLLQTICCGKSSNDDNENDTDEKDQKPLTASAYYLRALAPMFGIGLVWNILLSAYIFTRFESGLLYKDAAWHCWITAWTVGYVPLHFCLSTPPEDAAPDHPRLPELSLL
jgi:hypothetical protein